MFYNRNTEIHRLNERYQKGDAQLLIVYGRRRVGKTELLQQFVKGKSCIYFLADLSSEKEQLTQFSERIRLFSNDSSLTNNPFSNWYALFSYIRNLALKERLIVIIDEFQYLSSSNKSISSILQKVWDEELKKTSLFLVLCGSYVSLIEQELLAYKSPLYGRRSGQFYIEPMAFSQARLFFPNYSIDDQIRTFGMLGGIPAYLLQFESQISVEENIKQGFLYGDAFLNNETRFLLMEELREPRNYFAILRAIAFGATRVNEIVQSSGLDRGVVVKYMDVLQNLRIIRREVPVTEQQAEKSRKGIYLIKDDFFRFWFRFVLPNQSFIEENRQDYILQQRILPYLDQFLGRVFEKICVEYLRELNSTQARPFEMDRVGRYWEGNQEIDIVAFDRNRNQVFLAECKWSTKKVGLDILDNLQRKSEVINQVLPVKKIYYGLFSRSGFTDAILKKRSEDLILVDLRKLEEIFALLSAKSAAHYSSTTRQK